MAKEKEFSSAFSSLGSVNLNPAPRRSISQLWGKGEEDEVPKKKTYKKKKKNEIKKKAGEEQKDRLDRYRTKYDFDFSYEKLEKGYAKVPNQILMNLINSGISKNASRIYVLIVRMTIGYNRSETALSYSVIIANTGVPSSRIAKSINELVDLGFIRKVQGGVSTTNTFEILFNREKSYLDMKNEASESADVKNKTKPAKKGSSQKIDKGSNQKVIGNEALGSTSENRIEVESARLKKYFDEILIPEKNDKEFSAYSELRGIFDEGVIAQALDVVLKEGVSGKECHSPMRFLQSSGDIIFKKIKSKELAREKIQKELAKKEEDERLLRLKEAERIKIESDAIEAFEDAFNSSKKQTDYLLKQTKKYEKWNSKGFGDPVKLFRRDIILSWYRNEI